MHAASVWVLLQFRVLPRRVVCELRQHEVEQLEQSSIIPARPCNLLHN